MAMVQSVGAQFEQNAGSRTGPIAPSDRIAAIDMVRGIALFGVMAINVATVFRVSIFERFLPDGGDGTWLDRALYSILMAGIDLKAFALFSLLLGVGLAIQYDHLSADPRRTVLLVRRLAFLMLIGAAHLTLIWNGDILFEYAIAGFVVLFALMLARVPVGMAMGLVGVSGYAYLSGGGPALKLIGQTSMRTVTDYQFGVIPMPRKPMPSGRATSRNCARCAINSLAV